MSLLAPNEAEVVLLKTMVNKLAGQDFSLRLYTAPTTTPTETTVWADITEAAGSGYTGAATLTGANWSVSTDGFGVTTATYPQVTFSFSGAITVYGYVITGTDSGTKIMWIERFSGAPFVLPGGGGTIAVTVTVSLD